MELSNTKKAFKATSQQLATHQKTVRQIKKEVNAQKKTILAEQRVALAAIKKHKNEALADPQNLTLKVIKQDARLANKAVRAQTVSKLSELIKQMNNCLPVNIPA